MAAAELQPREASGTTLGLQRQLFSWVEVTVGAGTNGSTAAGQLQHRVFTAAQRPPAKVPRALGFYNVQQGDVPYFKSLADTYAMSDNFHQSVNGGTGANHIMFGHGDAIWFSDPNGDPRVPPHSPRFPGQQPADTAASSTRSRIRIPARTGHQQLVHRGRLRQLDKAGSALLRRRLLQRLLRSIPARRRADPAIPCGAAQSTPRCEAGHYYLLNNYNPGYFGNGNNAYTDTNPGQHAVHHPALHRCRASATA